MLIIGAHKIVISSTSLPLFVIFLQHFRGLVGAYYLVKQLSLLSLNQLTNDLPC